MWELTVMTTNSFAAVQTRIWFDEEFEARPYYDQIKEMMNKRRGNGGDVFEIKGKGGSAVIKLDDVHAVCLNDLNTDTFEKLHIMDGNRRAESAKHVLEKFGEEVANIWARMR